jgi:hypothetical protein
VSIDGVEVIDGPARREFGQLDGRSSLRFRHGHDGTPDRVLAGFVVRGREGATLAVAARHPRAGAVTFEVTLG